MRLRSLTHGLLALTLLSAGCSRVALTPRRSGAAFTRTLEAALRPEPSRPLRLVMFSDAYAVGVDATTGEERWRRPVRAFGPPVTVGDTVVVPVYGHRAIALDVNTGDTRWEHDLPGQVLTGLHASRYGVVVTALQPDPKPRRKPARSLVAGLSMHDGHVRWSRKSDTLLGVPAAVGKVGFVPHGGDVIAVSLRTGRTLGTREGVSASVDRVERHGQTVLASNGQELVDLAVATHYAYEQDLARFYERVDGIAHGLGHDAGVVYRLLPPPGAGAPRDALFLARRALLAIRLDERGRVSRARWVHARMDQHEYIDFVAMPDAVLLVRDDGALVLLDRATGRIRDEIDGVVVPQGVAFAGHTPPVAEKDDTVSRETTTAFLQGLIEDPDARLLPAQRMALTLLWRDPDPAVRRTVHDVARGLVRTDDGEETLALLDHAEALVDGETWGRGDDASVQKLAEALQAFDPRGDALRDATREAVEAGGPEVLAPLVSLLDQPELTATELDHVAIALRDISAPQTVDGVARFVTQYHADPEIVDASKAIYYLAELLVAHAAPDLPEHTTEQANTVATLALDAIVTDEFTVPALRVFVSSKLAERRPSQP